MCEENMPYNVLGSPSLTHTSLYQITIIRSRKIYDRNIFQKNGYYYYYSTSYLVKSFQIGNLDINYNLGKM